MGLFNFRPSVRPVPLEVHINGFPGKHYCPRMATMNKPAFKGEPYQNSDQSDASDMDKAVPSRDQGAERPKENGQKMRLRPMIF